MSTNTGYSTCDLYFAAYLATARVPMLRTYREEGRLYWVFESARHDIDALTTGWMSGEAMVAACTYAEKIKSLKSQCFGGMR